MEEKTAEISTATEESTTSLDPDDNSAGNVDPDTEELLPTDAPDKVETSDTVETLGTEETAETVETTETINPSESGEDESNVANTSVISADSNNDLIENNFILKDGSSTEVTASESTSEVVTSVTEEINTSGEILEESNNTNEDMKPSESVEITLPEEPANIEPEEKMETGTSVDTNSAVYELEEELKRLHGDTSDETKMDTFVGDISVSSILEDKEEPLNNKDSLDINSSKSNNILDIKNLEDDKPITKDSDLEEMLSADVILKEPELIKEAQNELKTTDVLICGRCHEVYHFVEEFQNHKSQLCSAKSTIVPICEGESKPQVWGFTLWKTKQNRSLKPGEPAPTSWKTYQKWCKLAPIDKNAWISAGQTIQFCQKIASATVTEVKTKAQSNAEKDPLLLDGFESNKENSNSDNSSRLNKGVGKISKPEPLPTPNTKPNDVNSNKALRTPSKSTEKSEFAVERIVAKRFNAKKKCWEYQIKWEHFPSDQNTWEPLTNLTHCKKMVDIFEEQLRKLKADKAKQVGIVSKNRKLSTLSTSSLESSTGRPQRSSKQKALNQVKAWCGSISDDEGSGLKRKLEDDDSDDSFEKKIKTEDFSDDSDFDLNSVMNTTPKVPPLRKIPQKQPQPAIQILKNGLDKSGPLPHNILIPDANGVVRINQKQLPSLSTGVYIMSKTAGIIKLDSNTSKVATSGGQTIVKVAPKIGQTQIKIVKKDGSTTATTKQVIPTTSTPIGTKVYKPIITKVKKPIETPKKIQEIPKRSPELKKTPEIKKVTEVKKQPEPLRLTPQQSKSIKAKEEPKKTLTSMMDMSAPEDEDSDDGLEELPFPEEIKIPEPESPPGEFVLDPTTGKIAGMEYPEKTEPEEPEPDPEPMEEEKSDSSLDNIVKLAAADITEDDLKNDDSMDDDPMVSNHEDDEELLHIPEKKTHQFRGESMVTTSGMAKTIIRMPVGATNRPQIKSQQRQQGSILNKVLTGTPIIRRTSVSSSPKVQQRILNQSVLKNTYGNIVRVGNTTYVRKPAVTKRPKQIIGAPSTRIIKAQHDPSGKNVYTYSRQVVQAGPRKVGNTTIRQATSLDLLAQQQKIQSPSTSLIANRPPGMPGTPGVRRVVHTGSNVHSTISGISPVKKEPLIRHNQEQQRKLVMPTRNQKTIHQIQSQSPTKPKAVINMPSLLGDDESETDSPPELTKPSSPSPTSPFTSSVITAPTGLLESSAIDESVAESMQDTMSGHSAEVEEVDQNPSSSETDGANTVNADLSSFTLADNENPIFITGDDGTVYQVAGQNEQGQTILLTQGSDGQQQCLLVTSEVAEAMESASGQTEQPPAEVPAPEINESLTEPLSVKTEADANDQVVAQVVRAEPPSPGGTHKVVVMLPDGNLMVTQVSPEEYASLELE